MPGWSCLTTEEIKAGVLNAIRELFERDEILLRIDANERTIAHRLAVYLEKQFPDWNVDCEYNRDGHGDPKVLPQLRRCVAEDREGADSSVFPDIIIHRRTMRSPADNLLVIEMKKTASGEGSSLDQRKLGEFTKSRRPTGTTFAYRLGLFLLLTTQGRTNRRDELRAEGIWFRNGAEEPQGLVSLFPGSQ